MENSGECQSRSPLRSPLKRKMTNESNTPIRNRYKPKNGYIKNLVKSEKILDEPTKTEPMDDGIDDSRELDEFEQELLNDEFGSESNEVKTEVKDEVVKTEVEEVEDEDLDTLDIDESSNQSWGTRTNIWEHNKLRHPDSVKTERATSVSPVGGSSGRTTPDNEIQPPLKKGRESFNDTKGFRTSNRNQKRDYRRKRDETKKLVEKETDEVVISRRQKQIDYGKVSVDYAEYTTGVPVLKREKYHPKTPEKYQKCSRRSFDQQVRIWKRNIHHWKDAETSNKQKMKIEEEELE